MVCYCNILPTMSSSPPLSELIFGIRIRTFGHRERFKRRSVFLMNHVCHFDWLYFWGVVERLGDLTAWKAITKDGIKKIPFLGRQCVCLHTHFVYTHLIVQEVIIVFIGLLLTFICVIGHWV